MVEVNLALVVLGSGVLFPEVVEEGRVTEGELIFLTRGNIYLMESQPLNSRPDFLDRQKDVGQDVEMVMFVLAD